MTMMRRLAQGAAFGAMVCAMSTAAYAQETTSAVRGVVTNHGAPVAKASVTAVHTPSGTRVVTTTEAGGTFDLRGLRVGGPYTVTITAPGVAPRVKTDVYLEVGQTLNMDTDLGVAEVAELVVTGSRTRDQDQGPKTVLGRADIAQVVSVNRDPRDLARRDMLVAQDLSGGRLGTNGGGVSIAGSNPRYNRIAVDGVAAQDNFGLAQGGMTTARGPVTLDAIEQFSVAAVPTDVENGDFVGGALNLVLKSGGNEFHGALFDNFLNDGLVGTKSEATKVKQAISQKNYGAFFSGPLWKDHVFFAVSYENYETIDPTAFGVAGSGAGNIFSNGLTQASIDNIVNIYNTKFTSKFPMGAVATTKPVTDKKYSGKLDWNINDQHRASLTYRYAESSSIQRTDLSATTASLDSHWYQQFNSDEAYTFEFHSHWTDQLTTFLKATYRDYNNMQLPPTGQNYSDVRVCLAPVSDAVTTSCPSNFDLVRWGPDQFRHANALREQEYRYQAQAEYALGDHLLKAGVQARQAKPFDVFVPNSRGQYYFDSIADFQAGKASELIYQNATTGNPTDAAFNATYWTYTLYAQDSWRVTDELKVAAGLRYDRYQEDDRPVLNPNFLARDGFSNQKTIDGLNIVMPRLSAEWTPKPNLRFSAGLGLFSGGTPDVLTGAPFYNTGFTTTQVDIQRNPDGTFKETGLTPGFTNAIGSAGLDNLTADSNFGFQIPTIIKQLQQGTLGGGTAVPGALNEVIALAPNFKMPSQWKLFLSGNWRVLDGWNLNADFVAVDVNNEITYYDNRAQPLVVNGVQQFLPDGRIRYDGLGAVPGKSSVNLGSNRDIIVADTDKGHSYTASITVSKSWDWGGDFMAGYAHQESRDTGGGVFFGTTAGSLYASVMAGNDPNRDYLGRSVYEIPNRFKLEFGYHHKWWGDNETRINVFAERQDGRPFGFAMADVGSVRGPVFGVNRQAQLLYVPDFTVAGAGPLDAGLVHFATAGDMANFKRYVANFDLPTGLVQKYSNDNPAISRLDLQLSQELPGVFPDHKIKVQFDVRNLLNLLNSDWGRVAEYTDVNTLARVQCADANGVAIPTTSAACPRYLYSQVPTSVPKTQNPALSLWYVQIGLRYEF